MNETPSQVLVDLSDICERQHRLLMRLATILAQLGWSDGTDYVKEANTIYAEYTGGMPL